MSARSEDLTADLLHDLTEEQAQPAPAPKTPQAPKAPKAAAADDRTGAVGCRRDPVVSGPERLAAPAADP